MDESRETYRSAFLPCFRVTACYSVLLLWGLMLAQQGLSVNPVGLLAAALGAAGMCAALTLLAVLCFPVYVGPAAIRSYNFWGLYRTVTWTEIESVHRFNFLGLRYVVATTPGQSRIYIPLFLSGMERFRQRVRGYAGDSNLLAQELDEA